MSSGNFLRLFGLLCAFASFALQSQVPAQLTRGRDVTDEDIAEILRILETHTTDLTDLRIKQGQTSDLLEEMKPTLDKHQEEIDSLREQLNQETEERIRTVQELSTLVQSLQATIGELRGLVDSNTNRLNVHDGDIGGINGRVGTNEYNIQVLSNNLRESGLAFHAELYTGGQYPDNSVVTYNNKIVDNFGALDQNSGMFRAPFAGTYGFFFYAQYYCLPGRDSDGVLYALRNDDLIRILQCQNRDIDNWQSSTAYFAFRLGAGETVRIHSGSSQIQMYGQPATWMGFLLQKD